MLLTKIKKKQGPLIHLSIDDKIVKTHSDIQVKDLNSNDEVEILITKLKSLFVTDIHLTAFIAYDKVELFDRSAEMNILDSINNFKRLYTNIKKLWYGTFHSSTCLYVA